MSYQELQSQLDSLKTEIAPLQATYEQAGQRGAIPEQAGACGVWCSYERTHGFRSSNPDCDACNGVSKILVQYRSLSQQITDLEPKVAEAKKKEPIVVQTAAPAPTPQPELAPAPSMSEPRIPIFVDTRQTPDGFFGTCTSCTKKDEISTPLLLLAGLAFVLLAVFH